MLVECSVECRNELDGVPCSLFWGVIDRAAMSWFDRCDTCGAEPWWAAGWLGSAPWPGGVGGGVPSRWCCCLMGVMAAACWNGMGLLVLSVGGGFECSSQ